MKSVNKVIILGNVGKEPEVKYLPNGTAVATFSVAVNERFKDKEGNWQDRTEWVNVKAWAKLAEVVGEYVHKGKQVYVEGKLNTQSWEDRETGQKKFKTEVVVNDLVLLGGNRDEDGGGRQERNDGEPTGASTDDDIPF